MLDDISFLKAFGMAKVFYSTSYGGRKDGKGRLFALQASDNTGYLPAFLSFFETTSKINLKAPVKLGAVIAPGYFGVAVNSDMLDSAIRSNG